MGFPCLLIPRAQTRPFPRLPGASPPPVLSCAKLGNRGRCCQELGARLFQQLCICCSRHQESQTPSRCGPQARTLTSASGARPWVCLVQGCASGPSQGGGSHEGWDGACRGHCGWKDRRLPKSMFPPPALPQVSLQKESQGSGTFESLRLGPLR